MSYKPARPKPVPRPIEEELRRDVVCPHCGLMHAVFGLATWCPDCGEDIFLCHVTNELEIVDRMLSVIDDRRAQLGARVAGRDVENALEDVVSIFEVVLKVITGRHLARQGMRHEEVVATIERKVRNRYQNVASAASTFEQYVGFDLFDGFSDEDVGSLRITFEKRHPITHNLGIIDRKYLERVRTGELEGREIRVTPAEVARAARTACRVRSQAYHRALQPSPE